MTAHATGEDIRSYDIALGASQSEPTLIIRALGTK